MPENLDLLDDVAGSVIINGVTHTVLSMDGDGWRLMRSVSLGECKDETALYDLAARLAPTAPVLTLSGKKLGVLLGIAQSPGQQVEDLFPNADGPTVPTPPAQG